MKAILVGAIAASALLAGAPAMARDHDHDRDRGHHHRHRVCEMRPHHRLCFYR